MKLRRDVDLLSALDDDFSWRIQEISQLKRLSSGPVKERSRAAQRAAIPMAYAHWEGFVKNAACHYVQFVSTQVRTGSELKPCLLGLALKSKFDEVDKSNKSFRLWHEAVLLVSEIEDQKPYLNLRTRIEKIGNLDFQTFHEIAQLCGISSTPYRTRQQFIDSTLVANRNNIAHGEHLFPDQEEIEQCFEISVDLIRNFKTDIENKAVTKDYLRH